MSLIGKAMIPTLKSGANKSNHQAQVSILAICENCDKHQEVANDNFTCIDYHRLTSATLMQHQPDVILAPLFAPNFDCFDLADKLVAAGYQGRFHAAVESLPDPSMIKREFSAKYPELELEVIVMEHHRQAEQTEA
ncbi:MAG: hypothetical protein P8X76_11435 [Maritimibacter sp.]